MQYRTVVRYLLHQAAGDIARIARWGVKAPRYAQLVHVDPLQCHRVYDGWRRYHSAQVVDGDWDLNVTLLEDNPKMRACRQHFEEGKPWEDTGIYEFMLSRIRERGGRHDGCSTLEDVIYRYSHLDAVYDQIRKEGRLRGAGELGSTFREAGGVVVHFDRCARPIFSGRGVHRLAIARVLKLGSMPAMVGVVHRGALIGEWKRLSATMPSPKREARDTDC